MSEPRLPHPQLNLTPMPKWDSSKLTDAEKVRWALAYLRSRESRSDG